MDGESFIEFTREMTRYICDYHANIRDRRVMPTVKPGYLRPLLPDEAPETAEKWKDVMADIEKVIMPGVTHWQSPRFHAYFPANISYACIVADMLINGLSLQGFNWSASPACTELEVEVLNWLGKLLGLPKEFLACSGGKGGGVIQTSACESTFVTLMAAKNRKIEEVMMENQELTKLDIIPKLIAYTSEQGHSSIERAGLLAGVQFRHIPTDEDHQMRGEPLIEAIRRDKEQGLIPFYVGATYGTTSTCAFDKVSEFGPFCQQERIWIHVDAAHSGAILICPEYRYLSEGIEFAESFVFNPHKWLFTTFDCSTLWLKDPSWIVRCINGDEIPQADVNPRFPEYWQWQIPFGRRFRALKLWFVLRAIGVQNLRNLIRQHIALAHQFKEFILTDSRFELAANVLVALVCFRLKGSNERSEKLLKMINGRGKIYLVPAKVGSTYLLRITVGMHHTINDLKVTWLEIQNTANELEKDLVKVNNNI